MTSYRLFIPLFICFSLTSLYTSDDDTESRGARVVKSIVANKDFTIEFYEEGFKISSTQPLTEALSLDLTRQLTIKLRDSQGSRAYGTFRRSPTEDVGVGVGVGVDVVAEITDPQPECCLLWCIPKCLRNCLKRICCC